MTFFPLARPLAPSPQILAPRAAIVFVVAAVLVTGCGLGSPPKSSSAASDESREGRELESPAASLGTGKPDKATAVATLHSLLTAIETKDFDKVRGMMYTPYRKHDTSYTAIVTDGHLSRQGIEILAGQGEWIRTDPNNLGDGAVEALAKQNMKPEDRYTLDFDKAHATFHWDGQRFIVIGVHHIGTLR